MLLLRMRERRRADGNDESEDENPKSCDHEFSC
jgi:hypothetical protein